MYFLSCISYAAQHVIKGKLRRNHFFFWHLTPDLMQDDAGQPAAETLAWRKTKSALCLTAWFCPANMFEECLTKMLHHAEANTFCNLILTLSVDWILMKGNQPREVWRRNPNKFPQSCFFSLLFLMSKLLNPWLLLNVIRLNWVQEHWFSVAHFFPSNMTISPYKGVSDARVSQGLKFFLLRRRPWSLKVLRGETLTQIRIRITFIVIG